MKTPFVSTCAVLFFSLQRAPAFGQGSPGPCGANGGAYLNQQTFANHCAQLGITFQTAWNFQPHDLNAGGSATLNDLLSISTHASNANDPWSNGPTNTWPAALCNVQFSSNTTPNGRFTPRGVGGLTFNVGASSVADCWLRPTVDADSLSISCEVPAATRCQAIALDIAGAGFKRLRVFSEEDFGVYSRDAIVNVPNGEHLFVGFIARRILRIDLLSFDGPELLFSMSLGRRASCPSCAGTGVIDVTDLLGVITHWGEVNTPCDFNGDGINVNDLLNVIAHWNQGCDQPCLDVDPSLGHCSSDSDCLPGVCNHAACKPSVCFCVNGQWICTTDCCGWCN